SVFPISLPDLKDRPEDILPLAQHFLSQMNEKHHKSIVRISSPAANMLQTYSWPGNVRELENCIERAVITANDDCIHGYNLPPALQTADYLEEPFADEGQKTLEQQVLAFEKHVIENTLRRNNGNRTAAGRELGLSPRMMNYYINRVGLQGHGMS
ncbi:MAG: hypothetical protein IJS15_02895, partial [Victivallales bacterium]|nr:hypothetical protein [Victivallales bacterium]